MKLKKRLLALSLAVISVFTLAASAGAANESYSGISFTTGVSRRFLYSDSPEIITSSNSTNGYLAGTTFTANERMDFEFYHHNASGSTKRFGIVVQNGNSSAVTLTIHNKAIGTAARTQKDEQNMTAPLLRDFFNSSATTVTIPANSSQFVLYADVANNKMVNGKLSMTSNKGNVYARIVYGSTGTAASTYFNIANQEPATSSSFFSGQLNYTQKNATVNANTTSAFVLGEWPADRNFKNTNEYTGVLSYKSGGNSMHPGNYGVIYQIKFTNLNGKKVKLVPDWTNTYRQCNRIVFKGASSWYTASQLTSSSAAQTMTLVNDTLTIAIPGGNCADLRFVIE